jgi:hypothetical protein
MMELEGMEELQAMGGQGMEGPAAEQGMKELKEIEEPVAETRPQVICLKS